jgi:exosome complex component MTR3
VEVIVTILEGEEDYWWGDNQSVRGEKPVGQFGMMSVLSGCITVASAAIADAGIDCVDMVSGGVAALVRDQEDSTPGSKQSSSHPSLVLDPIPSEHSEILAACVLGYLPSRDEVTNLWMKGKLGKDGRENPVEAPNYEILTESAVQAAKGSNRVLTTALRESVELKIQG